MRPEGRQRSGLTRREALAAAAAASAAAALPAGSASAAGVTERLDFATAGDGDGWGAGWTTIDVANMRRAGGAGVLEAGSDVFPNDPRPVAFAIDNRFRDGEVRALVSRPGSESGVVLRRVTPRTYYAAIFDSEAGALLIARRTPDELVELARTGATAALAPVTLTFRASGASPTRLAATLSDATGRSFSVEASDSSEALQAAGDPGVLAAAQTFLTTGETAFAPFGNSRLAFFGTQEGLALAGSPAGQAFIDRVRESSTVAFNEIAFESAEAPQRTPAAVVAATSGLPIRGGARLNVATDLPASVRIELSGSPRFRRTQTVRAGGTDELNAAITAVEAGARGRVYWRARVRRRGLEQVGPVRSFRVLPRGGDPRPVTLAIGACGNRFGPIFDHIAATQPDVFVWQGDVNYPDATGPLAQTTAGYAGMWRDFLRNPRLAPILERGLFAPQRDDHDYGLQDARAANLPPHGLGPWESLMANRTRYRFAAGVVEVWVLNERHFKDDPSLPDTPEKSLLGARQRTWLLRTLAASRAPFKLICSPCTLFYGDNERDGNWNARFTAERDLLLEHIRTRVSGRTVFVTGDAHDTMVYDRDGVFEARACPLDIPDPRDHPGVQAGMFGAEGVVYADTASHFALVEARGPRSRPTMDLTLVKEDGTRPFTKRFEVS